MAHPDPGLVFVHAVLKNANAHSKICVYKQIFVLPGCKYAKAHKQKCVCIK